MTKVAGEVVAAFDHIFPNWHLSNKFFKCYVNVMAAKILKKASQKADSGIYGKKVVKEWCLLWVFASAALQPYPALSLFPFMVETGCALGKQFAFVKWLYEFIPEEKELGPTSGPQVQAVSSVPS